MANNRVYQPNDPLFIQQWHLDNRGNTPKSIAGHDINVISVWPDYTGRGVLIGILDDGMENDHPDLAPNYRADLAWDVSLNVPGAQVRTSIDRHGVSVAGLAAGVADNGIGVAGVAYGATFTMHRLDMESNGEPLLAGYQLSAQKMVDSGIAVSSNSWGPGPTLNKDMLDAYHAASRYMAEMGRDGLGIVSLFAGGNDRTRGWNTNLDPTDNSPWSIIVAASSQDGAVAAYSTPGSSILIASTGSGWDDPPSSIVTTDRQGTEGYNKTPGEAGNYAYNFNGTSAATPIAAGVVALMLEANPNLGYRDVQEILAYSARRAVLLEQSVDKSFNGSRDWNGGALLTSHDLGYGHIDAHAAVRLAESWMKLGTVSNLVMADGQVNQASMTISSGSSGTVSASFAPNYRVEQVMVTAKIAVADFSGFRLDLISPSGTISRLMDLFADNFEEDDGDDDDPTLGDGLHHAFNTVRHWGEDLAGEWKLVLHYDGADHSIELQEWSIQAFTAGNATARQIFTDDFDDFAYFQGSRKSLDYRDGATLNAAAVTGDVRFDLAGENSYIGFTPVSLGDTSGYRNLISGDGNDILVGNDASNILMAGRGSNYIDGGASVDIARYLGTSSEHRLEVSSDEVLIVHGASTGGQVLDVLSNVELLHFEDRVVLTQAPTLRANTLFDERGYLDQNPDVAAAVQQGLIASAWEHYTHWGAKEARSPNALFNESWYLERYGDVKNAVSEGWLTSGFEHYQTWGWTEGRTPSAWMDTAAYLLGNPDVAAAQLDPLMHYLNYGYYEGRAITAIDLHMWA